jgi:hypothetical protein
VVSGEPRRAEQECAHHKTCLNKKYQVTPPTQARPMLSRSFSPC